MFDRILNKSQVNKIASKLFWWRSNNLGSLTRLPSTTLLKVTLLHGCFSRFLNCTNGANHAKHEALQNSVKKLLGPASLTGSKKPGNWVLFERIYKNFNNFHKIMSKGKEVDKSF